MPLKSVTKALNLPVETASDVRALFEAGLRIAAEPSPSRRGDLKRDLGDYFYYVGAVLPAAAVVLHPECVRLTDAALPAFDFGFLTWLYLLQGADDACVEALQTAFNGNFAVHEWWDRSPWSPEIDKRNANRIRRDMLAAIGTPAALTALAELSRRYDWTRYLTDLGYDVPAAPKPIRPRFTSWRRAIQAVPFPGSEADWRLRPNPIGLPLSDIIVPERETAIVWHYLSLDTSLLPFLPSLDVERLHLVSPRRQCMWTLFSKIEADGRYGESTVRMDEAENAEEDPETLQGLLEREKQPVQPRSVARLLPFDDELVYCNGHVNLTEGVYGQAGGPPGTAYPPPNCPYCGMLMFHVLTVDALIHEYGDAWRSLFVCEECRIAASYGVNWN